MIALWEKLTKSYDMKYITTTLSRSSLPLLLLIGFGQFACAPQGDCPPTEKIEAPASTALAPSPQPAIAPVQAPEPTPPPGKLSSIMAGLGADMRKVQQGVWSDDFVAIATHAMKVADHPMVNASEKERIQATLGSEFGDFIKRDKAVHARAVALSKAAEKKDISIVLEELALLQSDCVACHNAYRKELMIATK